MQNHELDKQLAAIDLDCLKLPANKSDDRLQRAMQSIDKDIAHNPNPELDMGKVDAEDVAKARSVVKNLLEDKNYLALEAEDRKASTEYWQYKETLEKKYEGVPDQKLESKEEMLAKGMDKSLVQKKIESRVALNGKVVEIEHEEVAKLEAAENKYYETSHATTAYQEKKANEAGAENDGDVRHLVVRAANGSYRREDTAQTAQHLPDGTDVSGTACTALNNKPPAHKTANGRY